MSDAPAATTIRQLEQALDEAIERARIAKSALKEAKAEAKAAKKARKKARKALIVAQAELDSAEAAAATSVRRSVPDAATRHRRIQARASAKDADQPSADGSATNEADA